MVLSPIEPVAPSTETVRTSDAVALLLRNGTALIVSPNHKTAADAIGATPQEPKKSRKGYGSDKPVQPVQQPAMAWNDLAGILDAEAPFYRGFEQVAELRNHRKKTAYRQQRPGFPETEPCKESCHGQAGDKAADSAGPGLLGADAGPEFWTPD